MALVNGFQGKVNSLQNQIANPFSSQVVPQFDPPDFPDGFLIEEILSNGNTGDKVVLVGNWMPQIPFTFGGGQRFKKEYYSGYSEPTVQIFGPEETDITINGLFKDKRFTNTELKNISTEIQQLVDAIRIRGNIVRLKLGEFERYGLISLTKFDMDRLSRVAYEITFSIIGFNAPKNARFLQRRKDVPFEINKELIAAATEFNLLKDTIPDTVPRSIADQINDITDTVSRAITTVTNYVDQVFTTVQDIKSAINRIKGLVLFTQQRLRQFKRQLGAISSFDPTTSIAGRYSNARYQSGAIAQASGLTALLQRLKNQFSGLVNELPLARKLVKTGDNLQKIASEYYGSTNDWKEIYDYNDLSSTELEPGTLLEIPRL